MGFCFRRIKPDYKDYLGMDHPRFHRLVGLDPHRLGYLDLDRDRDFRC